MKKLFSTLIVIFFVFNLHAQQIKTAVHKFSSSAYLEKNKRQKTKGFILLGGGVALFTGGVIAMPHSNSKGGNEVPFVLAGMTMAATSVPFFIASFSSKHRSKLELKRNALAGSTGIEKNTYQTSVSLKINL